LLCRIFGSTDADARLDQVLAQITQGDRSLEKESPWELHKSPPFFGYLRRYSTFGENTASATLTTRVEASRKHEMVSMLPFVLRDVVVLAENHDPLPITEANKRDEIVEMAKDIKQLVEIYSIYGTFSLQHIASRQMQY
jgi:hypothetical protein